MNYRTKITERRLVFKDEYYTIKKKTGHTIFGGCQCYKDCTCHEDFVSMSFVDYVVMKKWGQGHKRSIYSTLAEAENQIENLKKCHKIWLDKKHQLNP